MHGAPHLFPGKFMRSLKIFLKFGTLLNGSVWSASPLQSIQMMIIDNYMKQCILKTSIIQEENTPLAKAEDVNAAGI